MLGRTQCTDELDNGIAQIVFNDKHSNRIVIKNGLPQGHNEGGPIFNIYLNDSLIDNLETIKLYCYEKNISAFYYADDSLKIAINDYNAQQLINNEYHNIKKINFDINNNKSKVLRYSRNKKKKQEFKTRPNLTINNDIILQCNQMKNKTINGLVLFIILIIEDFTHHHF